MDDPLEVARQLVTGYLIYAEEAPSRSDTKETATATLKAREPFDQVLTATLDKIGEDDIDFNHDLIAGLAKLVGDMIEWHHTIMRLYVGKTVTFDSTYERTGLSTWKGICEQWDK